MVQKLKKKSKDDILLLVENIADRAFDWLVDAIDQENMQILIENCEAFELNVTQVFNKHALRERYTSEEFKPVTCNIFSDYVNPKPIAEQVATLKHLLPNIGEANVELAKAPLPPGADGWFAIPRWEKLASTYSKAVEIIIDLINKQRKGNFSCGKDLDRLNLKQLACAKERLDIIGKAQRGYDILIVAAQFGRRYQGYSVRRARELFAPHEFGLGAFEVGCILINSDRLLKYYKDPAIFCTGDQITCMYQRAPNYTNIPFVLSFSNDEHKISCINLAGEAFSSASGFLPLELMDEP